MDVVRAKVERDKALEDDGASWVGGGEEAKQACGRAAIGDHVEHRSELCRLTQCSGSHTIKGIEKTRDTVEEGADLGIALHKVERKSSQNNTSVTYQVGHEEEDIFVCVVGSVQKRFCLAACSAISGRYVCCCRFRVSCTSWHRERM